MRRQYFYDVMQGSHAWLELRRGVVTASELHCVLANGKKGKDDPSKTRRKYMLTLIADRLGGQMAESYSNAHMERGKALEAEALAAYAFSRDVDPELVGFVKMGDDVGCSPDALIGENGMVQIKTALPHLQLERLLAPEFAGEHIAQIQGELWVCDREWSDLVSYWPGLPLVVNRVYRDEAKIKSIELGVMMFLNEMQELMNQLKAA